MGKPVKYQPGYYLLTKPIDPDEVWVVRVYRLRSELFEDAQKCGQPMWEHQSGQSSYFSGKYYQAHPVSKDQYEMLVSLWSQ